MDNLQSDLIVWYKLETDFFQDRVRHTKYLGKAKKRKEKVKEDWSNCEELGRDLVLSIGRSRKLRATGGQ